ncbi:MAG: LLM class F420-dependent oxidoreductase [SAR202 cluster bacterium]|nr:LLM class F420-dependent oxidoreductase [SAR202 cluster bacterium]
MEIGITMFVTQSSIHVSDLARYCEDFGFESLWLPEHSVIPVQTTSPWGGAADGTIPDWYYECTDPFVSLAHASAVTEKLKLGTGICLVPERNPIVLAKEIATLDHYSNGRFLFGIGSGWLKEETELFGVKFADRVNVMYESIQAMKQLWTQEESEYNGQFINFPPVISRPKPVQKPHPPIYVGGKAKKVFQRVVDWGDGWMPNRISPDEVAKGRQEIDRIAMEQSKNPADFSVSVFGQPPDKELLKAFEEAGADRVMIRFEGSSHSEVLRTLENIATDILD